MKASRLLRRLRPEHLLERHHKRHSNFLQWGEKINARALVVTEDEIRYHQRLSAQSEAQRYAN